MKITIHKNEWPIELVNGFDNDENKLGQTIYFPAKKIQISNILSLISIIKDCKNSAIEKSAEEIANRFFQMQCMLNSIKSSLQCWVAVKEKSFDTAWHHLIDAQEYCSVAMKIAQFEGLDNLESHLKL